MFFLGHSSAGNATFTNFGGGVAGADLGFVTIQRKLLEGHALHQHGHQHTGLARLSKWWGDIHWGKCRRPERHHHQQRRYGKQWFSGTHCGNRQRVRRERNVHEFARHGYGRAGRPVDFLRHGQRRQFVVHQRRGNCFGALAGLTNFTMSSSAAASTGVNEGGKFAFQIGGITEFHDTTNGGSGLSTNHAGQADSAYGGETNFYDSAMAGSRHVINEGGGGVNSFAGGMFFLGSSNAEAATLTNKGATNDSAMEGGVVYFQVNSKAGSATIVNEGSLFNNFGHNFTLGGTTQFSASASADHTQITNAAGLQASGSGGAHPLSRKRRKR